MPMKSQAQRAYLHIHHPEIAARWEAHTPKGKKLPEHVKKAVDELAAQIKHHDDPDSMYRADQLAKGIEVEKEHSDSVPVRKAISKGHLAEFGNYYTALDNMEEKLKEGKTAAYALGVNAALNSMTRR